MASNVTIPPTGSGTATPIIETIQNGGDSSQRQVVSVAGITVTPQVTPTVTAGAYTAGFVVGGVMSFANAVRSQNGINSGRLKNVAVACKTTQAGELDLFLFSANPSGSTFFDHGAPAIVAADLAKLIGKVTLEQIDNSLGANFTLWQASNLDLPFNLGSGTTLYGVLITTGTPSFGSTSDLIATLGIQDD